MTPPQAATQPAPRWGAEYSVMAEHPASLVMDRV